MIYELLYQRKELSLFQEVLDFMKLHSVSPDAFSIMIFDNCSCINEIFDSVRHFKFWRRKSKSKDVCDALIPTMADVYPEFSDRAVSKSLCPSYCSRGLSIDDGNVRGIMESYINFSKNNTSFDMIELDFKSIYENDLKIAPAAVEDNLSHCIIWNWPIPEIPPNASKTKVRNIYKDFVRTIGTTTSMKLSKTTRCISFSN